MRLLLLTANISEESKEISRSIANYMAENHRNVVFRTVDVLKTLNAFSFFLINKGFSILSKNLNKFSTKIYRKSTLSTKENYEKTFLYKLTKSAEPILLNKISMFEPDVVVCCHSIASDIICNLKAKNQELFNKIKIVSLFSNYCLPANFRFEKLSDIVVMPHEFLNDKFIHLGVNVQQEKYSFGIPINEKFNAKIDKIKARKVLSLDDKIFHIVCYIPTFTFKNAKKLIHNLIKTKNDIQITIVCVKNHKLNLKLKSYCKSKNINIKIYGVTNNFDLILSSADLCVANPNGLIFSECSVKGVPLISASKLAFEEDENRKTLQKENAIINVENFTLIDEKIDELINNENELTLIKENILKFSKPNATKDLCELLYKIKK